MNLNVENVAANFLAEMFRLENQLDRMLGSINYNQDEIQELRRRRNQLMRAKRAWQQAN